MRKREPQQLRMQTADLLLPHPFVRLQHLRLFPQTVLWLLPQIIRYLRNPYLQKRYSPARADTVLLCRKTYSHAL